MILVKLFWVNHLFFVSERANERFAKKNSDLVICSFVMSEPPEEIAHNSLFVMHERPERFAHSRSFVLSDLSESHTQSLILSERSEQMSQWANSQPWPKVLRRFFPKNKLFFSLVLNIILVG